MNLKEIEKVVGSIQSHLFRNSNSLSVGALKSHFRGAGIQFKEHQVYNPGDDVRFIDWKLSAKTNTTFIKTFEEERNVEIYVFIDVSETMLMGYKGKSKLQAAIELTCLLYLLAEKTKDKVASIILTDKQNILPLASGKEGITFLVSQLEKHNILTDAGKINLSLNDTSFDEQKVLGLLKSLVARGKEVVMFSDFNRFENIDIVNKLIYRNNFHCFQLLSPLDEAKTLPFAVFGLSKGEKKLVRVNQHEQGKLKGRHKKINVKDRYLDEFVREMV